MNRKEYSVYARVGVAIGVWTVTLALVCGLFGLLVIREVITLEFGCTAVFIIQTAMTLLVGWEVARKSPRKRLLLSMVVTGACILLSVVGKGLISPEAEIDWKRLILITIVGMIAGVFASSEKHKNYR